MCVSEFYIFFFRDKDLDPFSLHCKLSERFIHTPIDMCMKLVCLDFWSLPFLRFLLVYVFQLCLFIKWIHKQAEASSEDKVIYFKGNPHMINYLRLLGLSASVKGACVRVCVCRACACAAGLFSLVKRGDQLSNSSLKKLVIFSTKAHQRSMAASVGLVYGDIDLYKRPLTGGPPTL